MSETPQILVGLYDPWLVALSIAIAVLGSYAALNLGERLTAARGNTALIWLMGGSLIQGLGIWAMHYSGMWAFHLPIPVQYHWPTALLSLLTAVVAAFVSLLVVSRERMGLPRALVSSLFMGAGISGLHYVAMDSMRLKASCHYSAPIVALSVIFAVGFSLLSLWLTFLFRAGHSRQNRKIGGALLMGAAICLMHYTGMTAATFVQSDVEPNLARAVTVSFVDALAMSVLTVVVLVVALLTTLIDRLHNQRALLNELFEQTPEAVALTDADDVVLRTNKQFTRQFGYESEEILGRRLNELIVPDELQNEYRKHLQLSARGSAVETETIRRRKDGTTFLASIMRVPVSLPAHQSAIYAIYHDITERKRAEDDRAEAQRQLQSYSRRLIEAQEAEREKIARELHDQIGQILTAVKIDLQSILNLRPPPATATLLHQIVATVDQAIERVAELSFELRPLVLDDLGLPAAVRWYADNFALRTGIEAEVKTNFEDDERVTAELETTCFRIVQESLTNVARHAKATRLFINLERTVSELQCTIIDNGIGFQHTRASPLSALGLRGMEERAEAVGGRVEIDSAPGKGTRVRATFPLERK
ncbi:MAG TPA: MHYT domain-containing protein [Pyrinomonadaceae bacterium]|nr:MHYT domain-containing protein [Pyrinomonadaceae bacterium]